MSFEQGLSGLTAAARDLDVIGNNVANANTVGAKTSVAEFADVYANALNGAGGNSVGLGTTVSAVEQQFTQGDISTTGNPLDVAINGAGFLQLNNGGTTEYSRNGQLQLDKNGNLTNAQGSQVMGYAADSNGKIITGALTTLQLNSADLPPQITSNASLTMNLDARATVPTAAFDPNDPSTYSGATTVPVYDSLGRSHSVALYFSKASDNTWNINGTVDGTAMAGNPVGTVTFDATGKPTSASPLALTIPVGADAGNTETVNLDTNNMTQFGSSFGVTAVTQDGYASGKLSGFTISSDGTILGQYTNGGTRAQGQIALANFTNPQGLDPVGGNAWVASSSSGPATNGVPGTGTLGSLQSGAVESSTVDLTGELVNMITAQRVYQANAQTIKTEDDMLQTLVNLP